MTARIVLRRLPALGIALALVAHAAAAQQLRWQGADAAPPAPAPASAPGTTPTASGDYLSRMDTDRNGRISVAEYQDWLSYAFDGMDRNRDGVLSADEQPGGRGKAITRAEHRTRLAERFRRQDVDHSGQLDAKELAAPPQGR